MTATGLACCTFINLSRERAAQERPDSQNPEVVAAHHGDVGVLRLTGSSILDGDFAIDKNARPAVAYIDFDTRTIAVAGCKADVVFIDSFD